jgi:hypothetical protein
LVLVHFWWHRPERTIPFGPKSPFGNKLLPTVKIKKKKKKVFGNGLIATNPIATIPPICLKLKQRVLSPPLKQKGCFAAYTPITIIRHDENRLLVRQKCLRQKILNRRPQSRETERLSTFINSGWLIVRNIAIITQHVLKSMSQNWGVSTTTSSSLYY